MKEDADMEPDNDDKVAVPRWALRYILDNADLWDAGPTGMGYKSDKMSDAVAEIETALDP